MTSTLATSPSETVDDTFRVMGTDAHVIVVDGPPDAAAMARARLDALEGRWSRFRPDSELCRLNDRRGRPVVVSPLTFALLSRAADWWARTDGAFDPTVVAGLEDAGYDRSFEEIAPSTRCGTPSTPSPAPGCAAIVLDPLVGAVTLPPDVRIDLGGIAKGFAADLVVDDLRRAGAAGACVNLGGDLRVAGRPPAGASAWSVALDVDPSPVPSGPPTVLVLADGAVATSSRVRRTWTRGATTLHHIIDPRTGTPASTVWTSATVIAGRGIDAEPLAKAALLASTTGEASATLARHGATGVLVDPDGSLHPLAGAERHLVRRC